MSSVRIDPFFSKQPPLLFVDELRKPIHTIKPDWFCRTLPKAEETSAQGAYLINEFPDEENLLQTVVEDMNTFLQVYEIGGDRYPIRLVKSPTDCFEAYRILVKENECVLEAEDTEGIRRALIYLEDEMHRREGAILPLGVISRKPSVRTRITRGFFSPTNRPPKNQDELLDDIDYYPEEYLNRLAHDGTNGLWIYSHFSRLLTSAYFPEYGQDSEKRIAKLNRVIKKCKRYGIKVYIFGVEPSAIPAKMAPRHADIAGPESWNWSHTELFNTICTYTENGANYCIETTQKLMEQVPELGGIIDITYGERVTTCASLADICQCPRCRSHSRSEILAHNIDLLKEGIRRAGSKADFISWTYEHRECPMEEIQEYVRLAPADVMLMENFEDAGYTMQLGKTRQAIDYWLSYVGPSQMFEGASQTAVEEGKKMFAKMQVCCSHELATVPYIPAPGILFEKYAGARKYKVEGIMQCWYFGNYPSLMSKAAGELSFIDDFDTVCDFFAAKDQTCKDAFLEYLAGIYYGGKAKEAAAAWKYFEEGYKNYPVNIMFSYYGPVHDGVVWDLSLLPKDQSLPRSWLLMDKPDGDRIGECLQCGHTLEEAVLLTDRMKDNWRKGLACLPDNGPSEQQSLAKAINLLFSSANNILRFYELRRRLSKMTGQDIILDERSAAEAALQEMELLVEAEMQNSRLMIALCEEDSRLGYHSEAEGYKFFPEKLMDRIEKLEKLKECEFRLVRKNIEEGKPALPWYQGEHGPAYRMHKGAVKEALYEPIQKQASFRIAYDEEHIYVELQGKEDTEFRLYFEYELMWPSPGIIIKDGRITLTPDTYTHQSIWGERADKELAKYALIVSEPEKGHYVLSVSRTLCGWTSDCPLRAKIEADKVSWIYDEEPVHTLGKLDTSPGEFGWLLPKQQ